MYGQTFAADRGWEALKSNVNELLCEWGTAEYLAFHALDVPLDANVDGHFEQYKHSCIVQPEHCGFHCNKSNVTALDDGTRNCWFQQALYAS